MPNIKTDLNVHYNNYGYKWKLNLSSWMGWKDSTKNKITIYILQSIIII